MFYVTTDKNNEYIYNIDNKYNKQKKIIKEIKYYETEDYAKLEAYADELLKLDESLFAKAAEKLNAAAKRLREYEQYK